MCIMMIISAIAIPNYSTYKAKVEKQMDIASASIIYNAIVTLRNKDTISNIELNECINGIELSKENKNISVINKIIEFLEFTPEPVCKNHKFEIKYNSINGITININNSKIYPIN